MARRALASPPKAAFALAPRAFAEIYPDAVLARLRRASAPRPTPIPGASWKRHMRALRETEILFTGWGAPVLDEEFLAATPRLRAVFHAAGSVRLLVTPAVWRRGVRVFSARSTLAGAVADYAAAVILLSLKQHWRAARLVKEHRCFPSGAPVSGEHGAVVGLVGYGEVGRAVRARLRPLGLEVIVHDPFVAAAAIAADDARPVRLKALFQIADVVSLHASLTPESYGLVGAAALSLLKPGATLVNTACGELVDEDALIATLRRRPDLQAVLDVTAPEPPTEDSPLYDLPNLVLTPHLSGALGRGGRHYGEAIAEEYERFLWGRPPLREVDSGQIQLCPESPVLPL